MVLSGVIAVAAILWVGGVSTTLAAGATAALPAAFGGVLGMAGTLGAVRIGAAVAAGAAGLGASVGLGAAVGRRWVISVWQFQRVWPRLVQLAAVLRWV